MTKLFILKIGTWLKLKLAECALERKTEEGEGARDIYQDEEDHRRTGNFLPGGGGGGEPFAQKSLASCPNCYETVKKKRESYHALT